MEIIFAGITFVGLFFIWVILPTIIKRKRKSSTQTNE